MISLQIILELRPIKWEETQPCQEPGEKLSGRGNSIYKAPEVEKSLKSVEKSKETSVSGM